MFIVIKINNNNSKVLLECFSGVPIQICKGSMDLGDSKLNPSSMIDLKAELHKKYESFRLAKLAKSSEPLKHTKLKNKLDPPKVKKKNDILITKPKEEDDEETLALNKSRLALEAKARLYENIVSNSILIDDEQSENYLVDFQRKVLYGNVDSEKSRTTACSSERTNASTSYQNCDFNYDTYNTIPSSSHSEKEEKSDTDHPIHYQNVQFNEVRDHGTGYFAFSQDHEKRQEQMEELSSLRKETEDRRAAKEKLLKKRKAMLHSRLAKICERKNIDQSVLAAYKDPEPESIQEATSQQTDLSSIPIPEAAEEQPKKKAKVRPWDKGKDNLQHFVPEKKEFYAKSQNEWIREMREERKSEFAPPTSYLHKT